MCTVGFTSLFTVSSPASPPFSISVLTSSSPQCSRIVPCEPFWVDCDSWGYRIYQVPYPKFCPKREIWSTLAEAINVAQLQCPRFKSKARETLWL